MKAKFWQTKYFQHDPAMDKVIGTENKDFICQLSTKVTLLLPIHYLDFKDVPQQYTN